MLTQQLVNGVLLGATYALFGLGFTLMFGVLRVINLLYGVYFSFGALAALWLARVLGWPVWALLPAAAAASGLAAAVLDGLLLARLRRVRAPELASLMVTLGAALALYAAATNLIGTDIQRFPPSVVSGAAIEAFGVRVTVPQLMIVAASVLLVGGLVGLLHGTRLGLAIRAIAENPAAAGLMGVNAGRTAALVSFVSGALAGTGGVLIGLNFDAIQPYMGETMMLRGFAVVIVGGLGSIPGALLAGLLLGVAEVLTAAYVGSGIKEAVAFLALVLVLWTHPTGLFGRATVRRA